MEVSSFDDTMFIDKTAKENTQYYYAITAENFTNQESGFSNQVNLTSGTASIWYVSTSGNDNNDGSSENPFQTIQKAIDNSFRVKDTIVVAPGIYVENIFIPDESSITIASNYIQDYDTSFISSTVIDANQNGSAISINDTSSVLKLIGFSIKNGGPGISVSYADSLFLNNMVIKDNRPIYEGSGTGLYCLSTKFLSILHSSISNNHAQNGAGIYCFNVNSISIGHTHIYNNHSLYEGGGMYLSDSLSYLKIYNSIISHNSSGVTYADQWSNDRSGAAIYLRDYDYYEDDDVPKRFIITTIIYRCNSSIFSYCWWTFFCKFIHSYINHFLLHNEYEKSNIEIKNLVSICSQLFNPTIKIVSISVEPLWSKPIISLFIKLTLPFK